MEFFPWACAHTGCRCIQCDAGEPASQMVLCDHCSRAWHIGCLQPALPEVPADETWHCASCAAANLPPLKRILYCKTSGTYAAQQAMQVDPQTLEVAQVGRRRPPPLPPLRCIHHRRAACPTCFWPAIPLPAGCSHGVRYAGNGHPVRP